MSTVFTHRAFGPRAEEALQAVREEAARLEKLLSRFIAESEVSRVNASAGGPSVIVGEETFEVLSRAVELSKRSGGLFDVTVGPLVALWSKGKQTGDAPDEAVIRRVLPLVGYADLLLDARERTGRLRMPGQSIDLGGIGKGYAGDKFLQVFREYGVTSAFTNLGGNVVALGAKPDGSPWRVGIQHPRRQDALLGVLSVEDRAVVTSGDYQRYFVGRDGKSYHHILNPMTGYPADSGLVSATVVAENSMDADALSTMLFVAGKEKGLALLSQFPGAEAVVVDKGMKVTVTAGLKNRFQAADGVEFEISG
jgi:thiamine biosynthesis lipoprotein